MKVSDFTYHFPERLIAQKPAYPRDACRLMVLKRGNQSIQHAKFYELLDLLKEGDVLVFNNSKVLPARLTFMVGEKKGELFLTRKVDDQNWLAIGAPGKLLQPGFEAKVADNLTATVTEILPDGQRKVLFPESGRKLDQLLEKAGAPPFPPYIKKADASFEDYQTVYAEKKGSVAAPTAGLHFTKNLLHRLRDKGVQLEFVTLHVGLGTFLPIKVGRVEEHVMHSEHYHMDGATALRLQKAKKEGRRIIAVGTTSVRVLENSFDEKKGFHSGFGETSIYIYPGYRWKCVDGLITNFHLPQSTLLLLTCAFGGTKMVLRAYREAVKKHYRFYSFGDAMFIE